MGTEKTRVLEMEIRYCVQIKTTKRVADFSKQLLYSHANLWDYEAYHGREAGWVTFIGLVFHYLCIKQSYFLVT